MTDPHATPHDEIWARVPQAKTDPYESLVVCLIMLGLARRPDAELRSLKAVWVALQRGEFSDADLAFAKTEARDFLARWGLPDRALV